MPNMVDNVLVQSGWLSKINWTQVIALVASVLVVVTGGKFNITPEMQLAIVALIQAVQTVLTVVFRTYFTTTVTPSSAAKM